MITPTRRRSKAVDVESILEDLTRRQFVAPHRPVEEILTELAASHGLTLACVRKAAARLSIAPGHSIGRLLRAEVIQLAQAVYRVHQHGMQQRTGCPD